MFDDISVGDKFIMNCDGIGRSKGTEHAVHSVFEDYFTLEDGGLFRYRAFFDAHFDRASCSWED